MRTKISLILLKTEFFNSIGGAAAIATGSWSVAAAQGFRDGEGLPLEAVLRSASRIAGAVDVPVSADFEGGYAIDPDGVAASVAALLKTGIVGLNFEDQVVQGEGLHAIAAQAARIAAIRAVADQAGVALFINARTDVFFGSSKTPDGELMEEAIARAQAYAGAGADGFFAPGLDDLDLIAKLCEAQPLPVNIMRLNDVLDTQALAKVGVARISHGPAPYIAAMAALTAAAKAAL